MSLKSFDKFCEKTILADNRGAYEKEIFDERQKIIRSRLSNEALLIYAFAALINCVFMDTFYAWSETHSSAMTLLLAVVAVYYTIRLLSKGCLIGTSGIKSRQITAVMLIVIGVLNLVRFIVDIFKGRFILQSGGRLSNEFLFMAAFVLLLINGIITLIAVNTEIKRSKERGDTI